MSSFVACDRCINNRPRESPGAEAQQVTRSLARSLDINSNQPQASLFVYAWALLSSRHLGKFSDDSDLASFR